MMLSQLSVKHLIDVTHSDTLAQQDWQVTKLASTMQK